MALHSASILIVDDDRDILTSAHLFLKQYFTDVQTLSIPTNIISVLQAKRVDLVLLDMNYRRGDRNGDEGLGWLQRIMDFDPNIVVLPMTAYAEVDLAVKAVKKGAMDFITKPWQNEKLLSTVSAALQLRRSRTEIQQLKHERSLLQAELSGPFTDFIGSSLAIKQIKETIQKVAQTDASILITGENGVGKEVVARAIHKSSKRTNQPFVSVDLGAVPETLFESELFGVKKGAFTDAKEHKAGRFAMAHQGTLFLDEIGNVPIQMQPKLLGVLQNREMTPLGATKGETINVRLVSATNLDLSQAVAKGDFRQDLLFRINTVEIHVPPLRQRTEDISDLAQHFLAEYAKKYGRPGLTLSAHALRLLKEYHWPGNVRELQHAIERAVILSTGKSIQPGDFAFAQVSSTKFQETLNLDEMERQLIVKAIDKHKGNVSRAAKDLGITRAALYRRLEKHGL